MGIMPSGDTLSVTLFSIELAAALYVQTLKPEIWGVRVLMRMTAAILLLMGLAWPFLVTNFPAFATSDFALSMKSLASNAWAWFALLMVMMITLSLLPAIRQWWANRSFSPHVTKEPIPVQESVPLSPLESPNDEANKEKIANIFRTHGRPASEHIQQIAAELYGQLNSSESREKRAIAEIARRSLSIPCAFTCHTLSRALEEKEGSFPMLQRNLEDFFLAYYRLVLCVQTIDGLLERNVPPDKKRILWQDYHKKFLDDLRNLFAEKDFSTSQVRMKEGQHGPSN